MTSLGTTRKVLSITTLGSQPASEALPGAPFVAPGEPSPLWMVTREPLLNEFVVELQHLRLELMYQPQLERELRFSRSRLVEVRAAFASMIRRGEQSLHLLCQLICESFLSSYQLQSVAIGEVETSKERFTISQNLDQQELYSTTDIDLGNRQLSKLLFHDGKGWSKASLVANVVDYQPTEPNSYAIHRITTRIKAEEEIWNKVVDELFDLDSIVRRDKKLRHLSRYVKDIFGIKIVVGKEADAYRVQRALLGLRWDDDRLERHRVKPGEETRTLEWVEEKDYLSKGKRSGWGAIKSVVHWSGKTFEIQVQTLANFLHERELLTHESHTSFKANRERVRNEVGQRLPLFHFYQDLLRWLFLEAPAAPPAYPNTTVMLVE